MIKPRGVAYGMAVFCSGVASHFASGFVVVVWLLGVAATTFLFLTGKQK
jgi:hypothetical protein